MELNDEPMLFDWNFSELSDSKTFFPDLIYPVGVRYFNLYFELILLSSGYGGVSEVSGA